MKKLLVILIAVFMLFTINFLLLGKLFVATESGDIWGLHIYSPKVFLLIPLIPFIYIAEISMIFKKSKLTPKQQIAYWLFALIFDPLILYLIGTVQLHFSINE